MTIRAYNVGFGDCFLLTFHYPPQGTDAAVKRRVLIDFGSTGLPKSTESRMLDIAKDVARQCANEDGSPARLDAVVATHRHKDHISGFATNAKQTATGDIIAGLDPRVVIQPWTEDPRAEPEALAPTASIFEQGKAKSLKPGHYRAALDHMHAVSESVLQEARRPGLKIGPTVRKQLEFLGDDNLKNRSAVENLAAMGARHRACYVSCGSKSGLEDILPGVKTTVLGPPTLQQSESIRQQRDKDPEEFWHLRAFWQFQALAGESAADGKPLFPRADHYKPQNIPPHARWFVRRADAIRGDQLLGLVRALDDAMNNTSVILLFQVRRTKILFPGDAQIENWLYALEQPKLRRMLTDVQVYKVGHHGSLNATPKKLWNAFTRKDAKEADPGRLKTIVSTMAGKHGHSQSGTEVPRKTLVHELEEHSEFFSTQELRGKIFWKDIEVPL